MSNVPYHIETSQLICSANQLTGFYMMRNTGRCWVEFSIKFLDHEFCIRNDTHQFDISTRDRLQISFLILSKFKQIN